MNEEKGYKIEWNKPTGLSKRTKWIIFLMVSFLLILILSSPLEQTSAPISENTSSKTTYQPTVPELYGQAVEFVKAGLKSPSTADFPWTPTRTGTDGTGLYQVIGFVDSQNSFGAMIRSDWTVNMRLVGKEWILEEMMIGGEIVYQNKQSKKIVTPNKSVSTKGQTTSPSVLKVSSKEKQNSTFEKVALFGEKVKLSDKNITVYSVGEYIPQNNTSREGYRFIYVDAEIENLTDEDIHCTLFELTDDKGKEYESGYPSMRNDPSWLVFCPISPYKKERGYSIFEVPITREYFQVKYFNSMGIGKESLITITFKPYSGWKLESRVQGS